ncbi:hypothetical protein BGZ76_005632, partial [Entomortierella beljakovae]
IFVTELDFPAHKLVLFAISLENTHKLFQDNNIFIWDGVRKTPGNILDDSDESDSGLLNANHNSASFYQLDII